MNDESGVTQAPIETMYRAGVERIPAVAAQVSGAVQSLQLASADVNVQSALAGDPKGMRSTLEICEELHAALRQLTVSLNHCASAVVEAADDFVATDKKARQDFQRMDAQLRSAGVTPAFEVAEMDDLSAPGATQVSTPDDNSPSKTHQTHIDSTPGPDQLPTAEENQRERDERIDDAVAVPGVASP